MQAGHIQESVLPGAVRSQAEQDEAQLVKASQQGDRMPLRSNSANRSIFANMSVS